MNATLLAPRRLQKEDSRKGFRSGVDELDTWFEKFAWENQRNNNAVTYVACTDKRVVGYYALAAGGVSKASVDVHFAMRRPSDIPCILLARLAVDERATGQGIGMAMLQDALRRTLAAGESLGAACVLIHCRDAAANSFYMHHVDALASPADPLQLVVPMKRIEALLVEQGQDGG